MATGLSEFKAAAVARDFTRLHELLSSDHLFPTSEVCDAVILCHCGTVTLAL